MRLWPLALALLGAAAAALPTGSEEHEWIVLVGGDTQGYLSPCGCTKPMSGGIRRRATAIEGLRKPGRTLVLENGGLVEGGGRQEELKAEAMAEYLTEIDADAVHVTSSETKLGSAVLLALANLAGDRLVSTSRSSESVKPTLVKGPFLVGGASPALGPLDEAAARILREAEARKKEPLAMFDGGLEAARELARKHPALKLVVYRSAGSPPTEPEKEGGTWLVTPGDRGRNLVELRFRGGSFSGYRSVNLGPEFKDHEAVSRIYRTYLERVDEEDLLSQVARSEGGAFAGTARCGSCHADALKVWKASEHSHALSSLEQDGHGRDPECVRCHVVGLASAQGFQSREKTPQLADVGCESCHGAGAAHAADPLTVRLRKVEEKDCVSCHDPDNSPRFDFPAYWKRIAH
ncbi:MAG TPA: cytochrome c family protein [Fimbriimonas sp.]